MCQAGSRTEAEKLFLISLKGEVGQSKNGMCHSENDIVLANKNRIRGQTKSCI